MSSKNLELDRAIENLKNLQPVSEKQVNQLCTDVKAVLLLEDPVPKVQAPVTICGDIHGQFHDLLELFKVGGDLPDVNYLFLGDFVDRGYHSVEVICLLLTLKLRYPKYITLLRGNHETRSITQTYGFYDECNKKYGNFNVWRTFMELFDYLPPAAVVAGKYFCMHGGIGEKNSFGGVDKIRAEMQKKRDDLSSGNLKFNEPGDNDALCCLLWSDPSEVSDFRASPRGTGWEFGPDQSKKYLYDNKLEVIVRAHQLMPDGIQTHHSNKVVTVFSAPNYCYRCGNKAAIIQIEDGTETAKQMNEEKSIKFEAAEREYNETPKRLPDYFL